MLNSTKVIDQFPPSIEASKSGCSISATRDTRYNATQNIFTIPENSLEVGWTRGQQTGTIENINKSTRRKKAHALKQRKIISKTAMSFSKDMESKLKYIPRVVSTQMTNVRQSSRSNSRESKQRIRGFRISKFKNEEPMQLQQT